MSLESPDNEKNFPGLYKQGSGSEPTADEEGGKKRDTSRKRDGKRDKKEKGYTMFEQEESEEELVVPEDVKSPTKVKKTKPGFKFPAKKDIFPRMKEKEEKKEKEGKKEEKTKEAKKEEKEKKKEEKEGKKLKIKEKKKSKHAHIDIKTTPASTCENPIFGIPLALAVERNKSHDGIELPAIVRECIDYVEECGLTCEGIYRISGVKSKVQHLKDCYNKGIPVDLVEHEPNIVASLLKQFLRELPEPVLTTSLMPKFEEASTIRSERKKVETLIHLINELPTCNRLLLSWMIVHMTHIIELQKENKMTLQNVSIVLSPTMQISHRVLNVLFTYAHQIFKDTYLKKYVPPLKPATSRWSLELPDNTGALEEELAKQESLLNQLHGRLNAGLGDTQAEEQLWEVQRVVTQLKRKIKFAQKAQGTAERRRKDLEAKRSSQLSETEELHLELRQAPAPQPPTTTTTAVVESQPKSAKQLPHEGQGEEAAVQVMESEKEDKPQKTKEESKEATAKAAKKAAEPAAKKKPLKEVEKEVGKGDAAKPPEPQEPSEPEKPKAADEEATSEQAASEAAQAPEAKSEVMKAAKEKVKDTEETKASEVETTAVQEQEKTEVSVSEMKKEDEKVETTEESVKESAPESEEKPEEAQADERVKAEEKQEGEIKDSAPQADVAQQRVETHRGSGEIGTVTDEEVTKTAEKVKEVPQPVPQPVPAEPKPRGPVQVHPHLYLSLEPLQPIKAQPLKPRRERVERTEESQGRSAKLRELEEELLGEGKKEKEVAVDTDQTDGEKAQFAEDEEYDYDVTDDEELQRLVEEEFSLRLEEEELLAIGDELRKKIETEESEIERLKQEIQELQYLRHDSDLEEMSSGSDSSLESEDEDDLVEMLSTLKQENLQLEKENADLCQKIHEERMICLSVKLQIRLLQQKQLESSQSSMLGD